MCLMAVLRIKKGSFCDKRGVNYQKVKIDTKLVCYRKEREKLNLDKNLPGFYLRRRPPHNENQTEVRTVDSNKLKVNQTLQGIYLS